MSIGEPIIWSLLGSLAVALILVPMAFPKLYRASSHQNGKLHRRRANWMLSMERLYGRILGWFMLRPFMGALLVLGLTLPGLFGYCYLKDVPRSEEEDNRYIALSVQIRGNPSAVELADAFSKWHQIIEPKKKELAINSVIFDWQLDKGLVHLYLDPIDSLRRHENEIQELVVSLLPPQLAIALDEHIIRAGSYSVKIPDKNSSDSSKNMSKGDDKYSGKSSSRRSSGRSSASSRSHQGKSSFRSSSISSSISSSSSSSGSTRISFRLMAQDEETIDIAWEKLRAVFEETPGVVNPGPTIEEPTTETELVLTRNAEERGWRADQLSRQITRYAGTRKLLTMPNGGDLTIGPLEREIRTIETVKASEVIKSDGDAELLENLVSRREAATQGEIRRRDGLNQRDLWIYVKNSERDDIRGHLNDYLDLADAPSGTQITLSYWEEHGKKEREQMILATILASIIIYLLMGVLFESILAPLSLMLTVLIAYFTVQAALKLLGIQLDNMVEVGLFLLIGVIVNHGVVLVDRLSHSVPLKRLDRRQNYYPMMALAAGARRRFTPVVLTSLVTIAAAFPMIFGHGRFNGDSIAGLGVTLAVGMFCGLFFTLFVVPLVYRWLGALRSVLLRLVHSC
jgi:multidrug efflux pump subunit AcrB